MTTVRECELLEMLHNMKMRHAEETRPIIEELARIRARKPLIIGPIDLDEDMMSLMDRDRE